MTSISNNVSTIVESLFPAFYKEEGPLFIQFVKAYYEWMEQQNNVEHHKQLLPEYFDIDKTIDDFLFQFKQQYLPDIDFAPETDRRSILKHAHEFLATKGTEEGYKLFFRLVYNNDVDIFYPKEQILRPSDGTWFEPKYLELKQAPKTSSFVGKNIVGATSGASAFAERLVTKTVGGKKFDVLYISNVKGEFRHNEPVTSDGQLDGCPIIVGSMSSIDVVESGKDFQVGDVVDVVSSTVGKSGKARVTKVGGATGRVLFDLIDGGFGFTTNTVVYVSDRVINLPSGEMKVAYTANNWPYKDFIALETVVQPMANVSCISVTANTLAVNTRIYGYYSNGAVAADGYIVGLTAYSSGNQTLKINTRFGSKAFSQANVAAIGTTGNSVTGIVSKIVDSSARAVVVGTSNSAVGIANISGTFTTNSSYAYVYGSMSNTYARIGTLSTGAGADFNVGRLTNTERVYINTDRVNANNVAGVPYLKIRLGSSNVASNVGFVGSVITSNVAANATHLYVNGGGTLYSDGQGVTFTGGTPTTAAVGHIVAVDGAIGTITIGTGGAGTGYSNNQQLIFSGGTPTTSAAGYVQTNANGTITSIILTNPGVGYVTAPTISVSANVTSQANLVVGLANGVIRSVVVDDLGYGYNSTPTASITGGTTGTAASLVVNVTYGYGFPKNPAADSKTVLNDVLTRGTFNLGTIDGLTDISLGSNYTQDPFVLVVEPGVAGFNRRDIAINHDNYVSDFIIGETVLQNFSNTQPIVNYTNKATASFEYGEVVFQPTTSATLNVNTAIANTTVRVNIGNTANVVAGQLIIGSGIPNRASVVSVTNTTAFVISSAPTTTTNNATVVYASNTAGARGTVTDITPSTSTTGSFVVTGVTGTFASNSTPVIGTTTAAIANVANVSSTTVLSAAKGIVKQTGNGSIVVSRRSFNTSFALNVPITGSVTGVSANVTSIGQDPASMPIGINANISAKAGIANGVIQSVEIIDSGFAYNDYESVELYKDGHPYVGDGYARLEKQGLGEGYFTSERGFLNGTYNYLHDNDYWQEYSYEVRTGISLARYADVLKRVSHVAGTKLFGSVIKSTSVEASIDLEGNAAVVTSDTKLTLGSGNAFISGELLKVGTNVIGFANSGTRTQITVPGAYQFIGNDFLYVPNTTNTTSTIEIDTASYDGTSNTTTVLSSNTRGVLLTANTTGVAYTNTYVITTDNTASYSVGEFVMQLDAGLISSMESNTTNADITNGRTTTATYRNATNGLSVASIGETRRLYNANGVYQGLLLEPAATNMLSYSNQLDNAYWTKNRTTIVANDILDLFGNQVADKVFPTATAGTHEVSAATTYTSGTTYTLSGFFKKAEYSYAALLLPASRFGTDQAAVINLTTGVATTVLGTPTVSVETYKDGWYRLCITKAATSTGSGAAYAHIADTTALTFTGNAAQGLYITGLQVEAADTASTYFPTTTAAATRAADKINFTSAGWAKQTNKSSGQVLAKDSTHLMVVPSVEIYTNKSNNYPMYVGQTLVQTDHTGTVAKGTVQFSNATHIICTRDLGPYTKFNATLSLANVEVIAYTTKTANLSLGESVTQTVNSVVVGTGTVLDTNATHVVVSSVNGHFITSNSTNTTWLLGGTSAARVRVQTSNTITASINATSDHIFFTSSDYIVGLDGGQRPVSNVAHNIVAKYHKVTVGINNAINTINVSDFQGKVATTNTVVGSTSNSSAIVTNIQRY